MRKHTLLWLTAVALILTLISPAFAAESPDPDHRCSLHFVMEWKDKKLTDGTLSLYPVALLTKTDVFYDFVLAEELKDCGLTLEHLEDPSLAAMFAVLAPEAGINPITAAISDGTAVFSDLRPGIYVVTQAPDQASTGYSPIAPFLISLPRWVEGEGYVYDLTAAPKSVPEQIPPETSEPTEPDDPTTPTEPGLPDTGQNQWPVPFMAVCGSLLFLLGWFLCFGKKGRA